MALGDLEWPRACNHFKEIFYSFEPASIIRQPCDSAQNMELRSLIIDNYFNCRIPDFEQELFRLWIDKNQDRCWLVIWSMTLIHVLELERNLNLIDDVSDKIGYPLHHLVARRAMSHKYESWIKIEQNKRNTMKFHSLEISLKKITYFDPKFENYVKNRIALVHPSKVNGTSGNAEMNVQLSITCR